ncbi:MAG: MFS transporter, partial [Chloroflexota bacterium]
SGLLSAGTVLATYRVESELEFFLVFGILGGIGSVIQNSALYGATVPKWFVRRRGSAVALVTMGSPVATMVLPSLFAGVIDADGWRMAWVVMGVLSILLAVLPGFLLVSQPEDVGLHPDGATGRDATAAAAGSRREPSATLAQAVRSPVFWILNLALALGSLPVAGLPANLVPLFTDRGIGREVAVLGFSTYGLLGLLGRVFWGYLINRRSITAVLLILGVYGTAATPLIFFMEGDIAVIYAPLIAFGIGSYVSFNQLVWASYFGREHLGAITGAARPFASVAASLGPFLMAWLFDTWGSYDAGVHLMTGAWLLSTVALAWAMTTGKRRMTSETS